MKPTYNLVLGFLLLLLSSTGLATENLDEFDLQVKDWAEECRSEIIQQFELLLTSGRLIMPQLFDTFYIPISGTDPQKFHTQYDEVAEAVMQPIIDKYLKLDGRLVFVVLVDRKGYLPIHNRKFSRPLTGDIDTDAKWNRTKRIFNDRTGLTAAKNTKPLLVQRYSRDTGEEMTDLSIPIMIQNRHWGAVRIGYNQ